MIQNKQALGIFSAMMAVLIWSGFIIVSRMGGLSELTPFDVIAIRYATCLTLLLPIWLFFYRFNVFQAKYVVSALLGGLLYALFTFHGFKLSSATHGAILLPGLIPLFVAIISLLFLKTKLGRNKTIGLGLIAVSITLMFIQAVMDSGSLPIGDAYFILGAMCWAGYSVLLNHWHINPWQATFSLAFITSLFYLPIYLLFIPKNIMASSLEDIVLQMFYQGFLASIVQMLFYVQAVKIIGAQGMGSFMALVPVIAGIAGVMLLGEAHNLILWGCLFIVSFGVWLANRKPANTIHSDQLLKE